MRASRKLLVARCSRRKPREACPFSFTLRSLYVIAASRTRVNQVLVGQPCTTRLYIMTIQSTMELFAACTCMHRARCTESL